MNAARRRSEYLLFACAGETTSREAFKGCQLPAARGTLGIATVGDALHKLIPATTPAPCSVKEVCYPAAPHIQLNMCRVYGWLGSSGAEALS